MQRCQDGAQRAKMAEYAEEFLTKCRSKMNSTIVNKALYCILMVSKLRLNVKTLNTTDIIDYLLTTKKKLFSGRLVFVPHQLTRPFPLNSQKIR